MNIKSRKILKKIVIEGIIRLRGENYENCFF